MADIIEFPGARAREDEITEQEIADAIAATTMMDFDGDHELAARCHLKAAEILRGRALAAKADRILGPRRTAGPGDAA